MDLSPDSERLPPNTTIGGEELEHEHLSYIPRQEESGGAFSLQVLEFKTCLLEAVEELQIRRDAEIRFEEQISKLLLEKQELEWQKESLEHQLEAIAQQHAEALASVKKQFQGKIKVIEEEKGTHQLNAQSKDTEINGLKEELKVLQLSTYSLEKKSSELEQKLALQSRSKDSHLSQLGEVEKRFGLLSRLCATLKQAHGKLEHNVDEAMRVNRKLTSSNEKQDSTIISLKQELEEVNNKLVKVKASSVVHSESSSLSAREQHVQQLKHRLLMETEMNRKLLEENSAERVEKQELMRSLQVAQQLLLDQTPTVHRLERELQNHNEEQEALKRDLEAMRERSAAAEHEVVLLMKEHATNKTIWETERAVFVENITKEQQDHRSKREAYDELYQKHSQIREDGQARNSSDVLHSVVEEFTGDGSLNELYPDSELLSSGCVRGCVPTPTRDPDSLVVTVELAATGAMGGQPANSKQGQKTGQESSSYHQSLQRVESQIPLCLAATAVATSSPGGQNTHHGPADDQTDSLSTKAPYPVPRESDPTPLADVIDNSLCESTTLSISGPDNRSAYEAADTVTDLPTAAGRDRANRGPNEEVQSATKDEGTCKSEKVRSVKGQTVKTKDGCGQPDVYSENSKEANGAGEEERRRVDTEADSSRPEDFSRERLEEASLETHQTDKSGGGEEERTDREGVGLRSLACTPETEKESQTFADKRTRDIERSITLQDIDPLVNTEPSLSPSQNTPLEVIGIHADTSNVTAENGTAVPRVSKVFQHHPCDGESSSLWTATACPISVKTKEESTAQEIEAAAPNDQSEPLNQSPMYKLPSSSTLPHPLSDCNVHTIQLETEEIPSNNNLAGSSNTFKEIGGECDEPNEECLTMSTLVETQLLHPSQECSKPENSIESMSTDLSASLKPSNGSKLYLCVEDDCEISVQPTVDVDVRTTSPRDRAKIVGRLQVSPAPPFSAMPDDGRKEGYLDCCDTPSEDVEPQQQKTEQTKDVNVLPTDEISKPPNHPWNDASSPARIGSSEYLFANEDVLEHASLCGSKNYRSSFELVCVQRKWGSPVLNSNGSARVPECLPSIHVKQNRVLSVMSTGSSLPNASSVLWPLLSQTREQHGEWKEIRQAFRETATEDTEKRSSRSSNVPSVSTSSGTGSGVVYGNPIPVVPDPCSGSSSGSNWFLPSSQENDVQQSSFRAQISRIEQFLSKERLRLPKRRRTDN